MKRRQVTIKVLTRQEHFAHHDDDDLNMTAQERIALAWQMAKEAYGIQDEPDDQPSPWRHVVRVVRRRQRRKKKQ
ncbi:MAG: hypothetical protein WD042_19335 [Phycisphaeraceae bacterium]